MCVQPQHWRWIWTSESCIWPKTSWTVCRTRLSWGICWSSTTTSRFWTWETITYWTQVWPQISSVSWLLVSCFSNACTCLQPAVFAFARFLRVGIYMWGSEGAEEGFGHSGALEQPAHTQWNGIPGRRFGKHTHTHTHNCVTKVSMSKSTSLGLIQTKNNTTKQSESPTDFVPRLFTPTIRHKFVCNKCVNLKEIVLHFILGVVVTV